MMEFAVTYAEVRSIYELFPGWRNDANANMFDSAGLSYFEAAFDFVRKDGFAIVTHLQNAYRKHRKKGPGLFSVITFLNKTPALDDLQINPEPDIIIKEWFATIGERIQKWIQENALSPLNVEKEFNKINRQLEYEWKAPKEPQGEAGQGNRVKKWTVDLANEAILPIIRKHCKTPLKLTARFLEQKSGCPKSTIAKTPIWSTLKEIKRLFRVEQGKMQHKSMNLSGKMLRTLEKLEDGSVKLHTSHNKKNIECDE